MYKPLSVRFYIRAAKKDVNQETPLRIKVWYRAEKKWLYLQTDQRITPLQFRQELTTDGTTTSNADPKLAKDVVRYLEAVNMVMTNAVVNCRKDVSSDYLNRRVNGIVRRMRANAELGINQPILVGASPMDAAALKVCRGCKYFGEQCAAPWRYSYESELAPEFAAYNGICTKRVNSDGLRQPNPNTPAETGILEDKNNERQ